MKLIRWKFYRDPLSSECSCDIEEAQTGAYVLYSDVERLQAEKEGLVKALNKINDLRNDIVGRQAIGFSRHVYPLVAILNEAGFPGMPYEEAKRAALSATGEGKV